MKNDKKEIKIGSALGISHIFIQSIVSLIYIPLLLKGIGKAEYGLYQILGSIIAYFLAMEAPLSASVTRYYTLFKIENNREKMENTLAISRRIFLIISAIFTVLSIPSIFILRSVYAHSFTTWELKEATIMFIIMMLNIIVSLNNYIYVACINANEKFIFLKSVSIIFLILQPIAVVLFIRRQPSAYIIVIVQLIANIMISVIRMIYCKRKLGVKIIYHGKDKDLVKNIFSLSVFVLIVAIADQIFWKTDQLILGVKYGTELVSVYAVGAQINSMFISVGCVLNGLLLPTVTQLSKEENADEKLSLFFGKIARIQSYLILLMVTGVIAFGKEFIFIISDQTFADAYYIALLLMVPFSIDLIQNCGHSILQVKNLYHYKSITWGIIAVINLGLTFLFIYLYGMIGAALATTVSIVIGEIIMNFIYYFKAKINILNFIKNVSFIWIAATCVFILSFLINKIIIDNIYLQFVLHVFIYVIAYILVMLIVMNKNERNFLNNSLKKIIRRKKIDKENNSEN